MTSVKFGLYHQDVLLIDLAVAKFFKIRMGLLPPYPPTSTGSTDEIKDLALSIQQLAISTQPERRSDQGKRRFNANTRAKRDFDRSVTVRSNWGWTFVFSKTEMMIIYLTKVNIFAILFP